MLPKRYELFKHLDPNQDHEYLLRVISEKDWERIGKGELIFSKEGNLLRRRTNQEIIVCLVGNILDFLDAYGFPCFIVGLAFIGGYIIYSYDVYPEAAKFAETQFSNTPTKVKHCTTDDFQRQKCTLLQPGDEVGEFNEIVIVRSSKNEQFKVLLD